MSLDILGVQIADGSKNPDDEHTLSGGDGNNSFEAGLGVFQMHKNYTE